MGVGKGLAARPFPRFCGGRWSKKKRIRQRQSWINHALNGRAFQDTTLKALLQRVPGVLQQAYCPLWQVLESDFPFRDWTRQVLPRLQPHIRGTWCKLVQAERSHSTDIRRWQRVASRYETIEAICLLAGLLLLLLERDDRKRAVTVMQSMIRVLIIEHSKHPISPFVGDVFDACKNALWRDLKQDYFKSYDFRVACAAAEPLRICREQCLAAAAELSVDGVLLPGAAWETLPPAISTDVQFFRIEVPDPSRSKTALKMLAELEGATANESPFLAAFRKALSLTANEARELRPSYVLERVERDPNDERSLVRGLRMVRRGMSVEFVGRDQGDDKWIESPRDRWPWRYNLKPTHIAALLESPKQRDERLKFHPFPKTSRLLYFGKEFQPV